MFYVAPPIRLKHIGLGEPGVFLVWGPLMIGGTFFVATGTLPGWVWLASLPYAILVTTVLFGKHIDKIEADTAKRIRTLPVILGEQAARWTAMVLMVAFYPIVLGAVALGYVGPWVALVVLGLPRLLQVLRQFAAPRPASPPAVVRGLAPVVRRRRVHPHPPRGRPAGARPAPERVAADPPALGVAVPGRPQPVGEVSRAAADGGSGTRAGRAS